MNRRKFIRNMAAVPVAVAGVAVGVKVADRSNVLIHKGSVTGRWLSHNPQLQRMSVTEYQQRMVRILGKQRTVGLLYGSKRIDFWRKV